MSHYTEMKVNCLVKNEADLIAALKSLFGEKGVEVHEEGTNLAGGYDSQAGAKLKAHIVVRKEALRKAMSVTGYNDVGYQRMPDGTYKMHVDDMDFPMSYRDMVMQKYTEGVSARKLKMMGYSVKSEAQKDGTVKLVATKY